ncbi:sensor histidine kinase [Spirulina sp. CS-785/01]|uniref:sensor histidine kinase n=1 Tax=Spirulina sp. CS-785/01 TaxID=3021716 RepID=UPI00232B0510|nr:sensor histidine kinase [Spirulina sp. CS-785/01]MDB9312619.1 sensor histidine kinase [Spirulina sp. CS-785/01]
MNYLRFSSHPLKFLLYLEWSLLGLIAIAETLRFYWFHLPRFPLAKFPYLSLGCLILFGVMGLLLPQKRITEKIAYTALEFFLVFMLTGTGFVRLAALLYIVIVIRNCFIFQGHAKTTITGLAYLAFLTTQVQRIQYRPLRPMPPRGNVLDIERLLILTLISALLLGLVLVGLQLLVTAILAERKSREKLMIAHQKLRQYALKIEDIATLQERNRIAREIHDSLGHSLTAFNLHLEAALRLLETNPQEAHKLLQDAKELAGKSLQDVRHSVSALKSDPLEKKTLEEAIFSLIDNFQRSTNIVPQQTLQITTSLPQPVKTSAYRIIQESLTNICKYARATEVKITVITNPDLQVIIEDNGQGFNPNQNTTGFGLQGMRERVHALGGYFTIETAPQHGCKVIAVFQLAINN